MLFLKNFIKLFLILFIFYYNIYAQNFWVKHPSPTTKFLNKCFFTNNSNGWISGDSGTILHTTTGGNNWIIQYTLTFNSIEEIFFYSDRLGWALGYEVFPDSTSFLGTRVFTTTNGGLNWTNEMFPDTNIFLKAIYFLDSLNGFTGGSPGVIYKTIDGGKRWTQSAVDSTSKLILPVAEIKFLNNLTGYSSGGFRDIAGSMWKTTNGGMNWKVTIVGPEPLNDFFIIDQSRVIAVGGDFEYGSSYVKTSNAGADWIYDTLGIFGIAKGIDFRTPKEGWIAIGERFSFTRDTGNTWTSFFTPESLRIEDLCFTDTTYGWAVGYNGVILKYDATQSAISYSSELYPNSFSLLQNFPNPFNPKTVISYTIGAGQLAVSNNVSLRIFDVLGNEVITLINKKQNAGNYSIEFNGSDLPSGIYFYELKAGQLSQVRRMILMK